MMENINLVEILKDCPKGMELDCINYDGVVTFEGIIDRDCYPIKISINYGNESSIHTLTKYGQTCESPYCKCVIFPKGKTTWKGFIPPCKFKTGDVLVSTGGNIVLFSHIDSEDVVHYHCIIPTYSSFRIEENTKVGVGRYYDCVLANEQQRQRMYDKIKCSGYKYNQSINKLEKLITPKFKVGDIIQNKDGNKVEITHIEINDECYWYLSKITNELGSISFKDQHDWELVTYQVGDHFIHPTDPKLFVITEIRGYGNYRIQNFRGSSYVINKHNLYEYLKVSKWNSKWFKPFDKVLVRDSQHDYWSVALFSHIGNNEIYPYITSCTKFKYCIPYNVETKHLVGTTLEEPEFYKI